MTVKNSKGFIPVVILLAVVVLASVGFAVYKKNIPNSQVSQNVLGKEDASGSEEDTEDESENNKSADSFSKSEGNSDYSVSGTQKQESTKKPESRRLFSPKPVETPEVEDGEGEVEDEIETGDLEDSTEQTEYEVDSKEGKIKIKIKNENGEYEMEQENTELKVQSQLRISVDSETDNLTVTTSEGDRKVSVLPQEALDNIVSSGVLSSPLNIEFKLEEKGVVYKVEGNDSRKLLGLFSISIPKTISVSANSGLVVGIEQTFASKLLNFFSTQ